MSRDAAADEIRAAAWAEVRDLLELQLAPLGAPALEALAARPGESLLDIGCCGGDIALALADAVAPHGSVTGIDISAAVLAHAQPLSGAGVGCASCWATPSPSRSMPRRSTPPSRASA